MLTEFEKRHQREYETIFILDPQVPREMAERVVQRIHDVLERHEGQLVRVEYWGKRKLAYRIRRTDWGFYYLVRFLGRGGLVAELERNFRMLDPVLRFQTVLVKKDVNPANYQVQRSDIEFRLDLLAKEAAEFAAGQQAAAAAAAAPEPPAEAPRDETAGGDEVEAADEDTEDEETEAEEEETPETEIEDDDEQGGTS